MKFFAAICLAPLAVAGCMPTDESVLSAATPIVATDPDTATADAASKDKTSIVVASTFRAPAYAPMPIPRPDFEGVTPASRSLGAIIKDAEEVDVKLEEQAAVPAPTPTPQLVALATSSTIVATKPSVNSPGYYAAYDDTIVSCFPQTLRDALNVIADHYGQSVEVTSGMRNRGRSHSMHRSCAAADIRVAGVRPGALATFAKSVEGINGVGTYRYNDVTHVDVRQEKMAWRY
jgi:hypothetical protein